MNAHTTCSNRPFERHFHPLFAGSTPMERAFDEFWNGPGWPVHRRTAPAQPAMNAWETDGAIQIETELPGYAEKDVEVSLAGSELTISGARDVSHPEGALLHRNERSSGRFSRTLRLGSGFDAGKITATFDAGVLTITIPKVEAVKPRKIDIKTV
jgi:HSP20 family protein